MKTKKITVPAVSICLLLVLSAACAFSPLTQGNVSSNSLMTPNESNGLVVYTSFYTMKDFASKIGGERIQLNSIMPIGADPHDWEPTPAQISNLEYADIFIFNGAGIEHWVDKVLGALRNQSIIIVETTAGIDLLDGSCCSGSELNILHEHTTDPHVWLNPMKAKLQMQAIRDAFVQADSQNSDYFNENFKRYAAKLDELDKEFHEALYGLTNRTIVVSHEAFGYLCDAYNLIQIGISGPEANTEPSPARMAQIIELINEHEISVVFFEELASSRVVEAVARETGTRTAVLSSIEGLTDAQISVGDDYFTIMRQNLQALKEALS